MKSAQRYKKQKANTGGEWIGKGLGEMPRSKKKFVEKGTSTKFVLLHRSQQDAEWGKDGASEFVLYPVDRPGPLRKGAAVAEDAVIPLRTGRDHVNALGMANDGYNYERHMRAIGECKAEAKSR